MKQSNVSENGSQNQVIAYAKVYPKPRQKLILKKDESPKDFLSYFKTIEVKIIEPWCPFCSNHLHDLKCNCSSFLSAYKIFSEKFKVDAPQVELKDSSKLLLHVYTLSENNVEEQEIPWTQLNSMYCETGTICGTDKSDINEEFWFVSLGKIKDGNLTFMTRQFGRQEIFRYRVAQVNLSDLSEEKIQVYTTHQTVIPGGSHRIGDYRMEMKKEILAELTYKEFVQHLKSLR